MSRQNINTVEYWDRRFGTGDWSEKGGHSQTRQFTQAQLPRLNLPGDFGGTLCDLGCGAGDAFPIYREAYPRARLVGIDFSQAAVSRCQKEYGHIAQFICGDASAVPHSDIIICSNVLEHLDDDLAVARDLLRRCHTLYVIVPYREDPLSSEHVRLYDERSFAEFSPVRTEIFNAQGWSEFGRALYVDVHLKNLARRALGRPLRRRRRQILYEFRGTPATSRPAEAAGQRS